MQNSTHEVGCLPMLFVLALIGLTIGAFVGLTIGVANMVAGWFA